MRPEVLNFRRIVGKINTISYQDFYNDFKASYYEIIKIYGYDRTIDALQSILENDIKCLLTIYTFEKEESNMRTCQMLWEMVDMILSHTSTLGISLSSTFVKTHSNLFIIEENCTFSDYMERKHHIYALSWIDLLPEKLKNDTTINIFNKAIEKKFITPKQNCLSWNKLKAQLGYFVGKLYGYERGKDYEGNIGDHVAFLDMEKLFNVKRLDRALAQAYEAKEPQKWRKEIDALFE